MRFLVTLHKRSQSGPDKFAGRPSVEADSINQAVSRVVAVLPGHPDDYVIEAEPEMSEEDDDELWQ